MGSISYHIKHLIHTSIIFLPFFLCVIGHNSQSLLPPLPLPPILPPLPLPPIIPQLLNFLDQRLAVVYPIIQIFKNTIISDPLNITTTWTGSDICKYKGFYCDNPPDNATALALASIDFNGFQLSAPSLDGFIDQLPDIALFHANSNNFSGSVPPQIFMQNLDVLFLNNNNFMQKLPENLGNSPVFYLTLANNKFTGPIPRSILNASTRLTEVLFLNNLLTGCLPYELGFLRELTVFDAGNNLLTGPLPWSLGCLEKIELLNLAGNQLYGQVPEVLCALGNLVNLSLSDNYFTKVGPLCRKLIKIGVLNVRKNCIQYLPNQRPVEECVLFFMHPRYCPHPASFNIIPCQVSPSSQPPTQPKRNLSVVYNALSRHRL